MGTTVWPPLLHSWFPPNIRSSPNSLPAQRTVRKSSVVPSRSVIHHSSSSIPAKYQQNFETGHILKKISGFQITTENQRTSLSSRPTGERKRNKALYLLQRWTWGLKLVCDIHRVSIVMSAALFVCLLFVVTSDKSI